MADALLSPAVGLGAAAVSGAMLFYSAGKVSGDTEYQRKIPLMGVMGAFVFAAQMINFSIPGTGSSGHIGGGMLLAMLLGAYPAFIVISSVLLVQCLFFMDGGLLALGCNLFNLGFWPCFLGLPLYRWLAGGARDNWRESAACVAAVVVSLELGSAGVVMETLMSGRTELPASVFLPLMLAIHTPIALVEGFLTVAVIRFIRRIRTVSVVDDGLNVGAVSPAVLLFGMAVAMAAVLAWFASSRPDGLEWSIGKVSGQEELQPLAPSVLTIWAEKAQKSLSVFPDYSFSAESSVNVKAETWPKISLGTSVAGVSGVFTTLAFVVLLVFSMRMAARVKAK